MDWMLEIPRTSFMISVVSCNSGIHRNQDLVCFGLDHIIWRVLSVLSLVLDFFFSIFANQSLQADINLTSDFALSSQGATRSFALEKISDVIAAAGVSSSLSVRNFPNKSGSQNYSFLALCLLTHL